MLERGQDSARGTLKFTDYRNEATRWEKQKDNKLACIED